MSVVIVSFKLAVTDEADDTGLTEDDWVSVNDGIAQLGGYDLDFEKQAE